MKRLTNLVLVAGVTALAGCVTEPQPVLHDDFGNAVRADMAAQVIDPRAGTAEMPAAGLDGRSAEKAVEDYRKAKSEVKREKLLVEIGSGSSSSK